MNVSFNNNKVKNTDSPKTPGGISKSLLTPCRRVGLSRKWKKNGLSPFISPLGNTNSTRELQQECENRKRKICQTQEEKQYSREDQLNEFSSEICNSPKIEIDRTPTRSLLPRKKSKTLITNQKCLEENENVLQSIQELRDKNLVINEDKLLEDSNQQIKKYTNIIDIDENKGDTKQVKVCKLSRKNSKNSSKTNILESLLNNTNKSSINEVSDIHSDANKDIESKNNETLRNTDNIQRNIKEKSPNNLTKECIVVIQKKMLKTTKTSAINNVKEHREKKSASQSLFDSDSDDVPLSHLNKQDSKPKFANAEISQIENITKGAAIENNLTAKGTKYTTQQIAQKEFDTLEQIPHNTKEFAKTDFEDDDFVEVKKGNIKKVERTSITDLKKKTNTTPKTARLQTKSIAKSPLQTSNLCEDDDFDYSKNKTILIKKTYTKVAKLSKAKSTGSITQKDLDDITARIESKKSLLLAKTMTSETKELRELIKKWQVGCQTALMELLELMRKKLPEQNMEQSELLQMLKIPPDLVGYDSDSDTFNTPDDAAIILSALKLN